MTTTRVTWFEREPTGGTLHVLQVAPADTPRALAQRLVDDLTAMGAPGEVDAGIVPGGCSDTTARSRPVHPLTTREGAQHDRQRR